MRLAQDVGLWADPQIGRTGLWGDGDGSNGFAGAGAMAQGCEIGSWAMNRRGSLQGVGRDRQGCGCPQGPDRKIHVRGVKHFIPCNLLSRTYSLLYMPQIILKYAF